MSLLCRLFGHRIGYYPGHGADYGSVDYCGTDGIGREHWRLAVRCCRCGEQFHGGSFHAPLFIKASLPSRDDSKKKAPQ